MPRLMSVALTESAVVARSKTVTRRLGWGFLEAGVPLTLCRKVMGRKQGQPLVRIAEVEVVSVSRERLDAITQAEVELEGFHGWSAPEFVDFFCTHMRCQPSTEVRRIEWRYLDHAPTTNQPGR